MSIGLKRGAVSLEPHSAAWEEHAKETISVLEHILGSDAVDIQHVGSTAIVSIMAKPIFDISVAVKAFPDFLQHEEALEAAGIVFSQPSPPPMPKKPPLASADIARVC